jgi:acylaminoacyl-peptidase
MIRILVALALACALPLAAAELHPDPRHLQPRDVFDLEWANNPALSPDGKRIVYQRNHFDVMKDRRRSHLWLLDVDGDRHRPLTSGQGSDGAAVWSPDGGRIAWRRSGCAGWTRGRRPC